MGRPDTVSSRDLGEPVVEWGELRQEVWVESLTLPLFLAHSLAVPSIFSAAACSRGPPCSLAWLLGTGPYCPQGTFWVSSYCLNLLLCFWSCAGALVSFTGTWPCALVGGVAEELSSWSQREDFSPTPAPGGFPSQPPLLLIIIIAVVTSTPVQCSCTSMSFQSQ